MRSDDLCQRIHEAVVRRDRPAAEAALAALRAYADQLQAWSDEHQRLEALFESDPVAYWQEVAGILREEREVRQAIAAGDTGTPTDGVS